MKQTLKGPALAFKWPANVRESLERENVLDLIGEGLAAFGEQLRMEGLGLSTQKPALLYGPSGKPIA